MYRTGLIISNGIYTLNSNQYPYLFTKAKSIILRLCIKKEVAGIVFLWLGSVQMKLI